MGKDYGGPEPRSLWPTPCASETGVLAKPTETLLDGTRSHGWDLNVAMWDALYGDAREWPNQERVRTPKASESRKGDASLSRQVEGKGAFLTAHGKLNPEWVDWLMGYPIGWTDSRRLGMQLSLRSQSCSSDR
jgi:hypothetical protein